MADSRGFVRILVLLALALLAGAALVAFEATRRVQAPGPLSEETVVWIERGDSLKTVEDKLLTAGILEGPQLFYYYGRGTGVRDRLGILGLAVEVEKEIVNILVSNDQIDEILERIYKAGKLDTPGMGIAYVLPVEKAATHVPRELIDKLEG